MRQPRSVFLRWKRGSIIVERPPLYFDPEQRPAELELHRDDNHSAATTGLGAAGGLCVS